IRRRSRPDSRWSFRPARRRATVSCAARSTASTSSSAVEGALASQSTTRAARETGTSGKWKRWPTSSCRSTVRCCRASTWSRWARCISGSPPASDSAWFAKTLQTRSYRQWRPGRCAASRPRSSCASCATASTRCGGRSRAWRTASSQCCRARTIAATASCDRCAESERSASERRTPMSEFGGDRDRASRDLACDLAVTAGAGAGKTTVLVDRFVALARDPEVGPERILALTFTHKAAGEMKERAIRIFDASGETTLRRATEGAYISTIHGFAERILRERPFDARIDPAFTVITEYEEKLWIEEAIHAMYERAELRAHARRLGREFGHGWSIFTLVREVARLMREGPAQARREADAMGDDDRVVELALARAREFVARAEREMLADMRALLPMLEGATFKSSGKRHAEW